MDSSKKPDLLAIATILATARTPYAIIDGVALQIHQAEPRTTLDIDLAVPDVTALPEGALVAAGLIRNGVFPQLGELGGPRRHTRSGLRRSGLSGRYRAIRHFDDRRNAAPRRRSAPAGKGQATRSPRPGPTPLETNSRPRRCGVAGGEPAESFGRAHPRGAVRDRSGLRLTVSRISDLFSSCSPSGRGLPAPTDGPDDNLVGCLCLPRSPCSSAYWPSGCESSSQPLRFFSA